MNIETLINQFKDSFTTETGIELDFRTHCFLENPHNLTPCFDYDFAKSAVTFLYVWANEYVDKYSEHFPESLDFQYNLNMKCEELRNSNLQSMIRDVCFELNRLYAY